MPYKKKILESYELGKGLEAAGEWHVLKELLPELQNKSVLDLG
ncbi:hypothetical protein GCM10011384_15270 [Psychrobacillus lasiicapitis]|nr:hypothetical protein GCM10011384_15270 [Psychrobacillus lasiicapitis]